MNDSPSRERSVPDPHSAPRARLFTIWNTVLYLESESGELRHGPIDSSPANTFFVAEVASSARRVGCLIHSLGEGSEPIVCRDDRCLTLSAATADDAAATATMFEMLPLERGLIALKSDGPLPQAPVLFLNAEPDGRVKLSNPVCSTWECFLASEDWCSAPLADTSTLDKAPALAIDRRRIADYIVDARERAKINAASTATKVLIYGYPAWSHGRVYYDICKHLQRQGYIVDIINWQVNHAAYIGELIAYYDLCISALDGVRMLVEVYGVPCERVIGLSHHENDMRTLIGEMGVDVFDRLAGFGVVGYQLYDAAVIFGIRRPPLVVPLGVDLEEFHADLPERLERVGYAGLFSHKTPEGIPIKRGELAKAAAATAGLEFKIAGSTGNAIGIHDMPDFYKSVDAILVSSVTEGAQLPVREAAAAGRLLISTPVGDFPLRASQGVGIVAPIEAHKYTKFVAAKLTYYKENPAEFFEMCRKTQEAARQLDWPNMIGDWVELIETAKDHVLDLARAHQEAGRFAEAARIFADWAERGGDAEERWYARWQHARCLRDQGDEDGFVLTALAVFRERPYGSQVPVSVLARLDIESEVQTAKEMGLVSPRELCRLMTDFGSDKGSPLHNYTIVYDQLFSSFRDEDLLIFELGLGSIKVGAPSSMGPHGKPGASLRGWRAYFRNARIFGADIDPDILFEEDRISTFWVDQRDPTAIRALWNSVGDKVFDVIVDDGLHEASANICFFVESFEKLKSGGIYIIEDITPGDIKIMEIFIANTSRVSKSIVFEELDHPVNKVDNRLVILQKA
jgi:glycosyltransferase involved in cell wall biosynthesis